MSVYSNNGTIFVSKSKPRGIYLIKITGTLPDLVSTASENFTIIILNTAPTFKTPLIDYTVPLKSSYNFTFPVIFDPDPDDTHTLMVKEYFSG